MAEISHQACPDEIECGADLCYSWNTDKEVGHCFSCDLRTIVRNGNLMGKSGKHGKYRVIKEMEDMADDIFDVADSGSTKEVKTSSGPSETRSMRGILKSVMDLYDVKVYPDTPWRSKKDRNITGKSDEIRFPYPSGNNKLRRLDLEKDDPNHFSSTGPTNELFGMDKFPAGCSKSVTIVEGEFDALAAYQMLSSSSYTNPVVALPTATPNGKLWKVAGPWLESFDKIILSLDSDGKADGVAETLFDLYPDKIYVMNHGIHKDANDFLMNGDAKAYSNAWWSPKKYSPAGFTASKDDWITAIEEEDPYTYVETPIDTYNKKGRGLVKGGLTIIKAPPGTGKSSLMRMLQHDLVMKHGVCVAALMMEEARATTGRAMATYELGKNVMTKEDAFNSEVSEKDVKEALVKVVGEEKFISFEINPQDPIEDTLRQCKFAVSVYGAEYIFIDHLQRLAYLSGTEGATAALTELGVKLTEFAKRKNIGIICISHVNSDGRTKYASSIEEEAIVVMELVRDKDSDDEVEKNSTYLIIGKNRPYALTGDAGCVIYDGETTMVAERAYKNSLMSDIKGKDPFDVS
jgi:twinkle protein